MLVAKNGSRTKLKHLRGFLNESLKSAYTLHENFMLRLDEEDPDFSDHWIEELSVRANTCFAAIDSYFVERENDPPSSMSSSKVRQISQWREESTKYSTISDSSDKPLFTENPEDDVFGERQTTNCDDYEEITNAFSRIHVEPNGNETANPLNNKQNTNNLIRSTSLPVLESQLTYQDRTDFQTAYINTTNMYSQAETQTQNRDPDLQQYTSTTNRGQKSEQRYTRVPKDLKCSLNSRFSEIETGTLHQPITQNLHRTYLVEMPEQRPILYEDKISPTKGEVPKKVRLLAEGPAERTLTTLSQPTVASADDWIDHLDSRLLEVPATPSNQADISMQLLIQQRLPRQTLVTFDGEPGKWVKFISKYFDLVHKQPFLDAFQKGTYLFQHLKGEALKSVEGFSNNNEGYVSSLKRLKYMFGNHALVAEATIRKITSGKQIPDSDPKALTDFYYSVSSCINTLRKMNYQSDIYSSHVLRQTLARLPERLLPRWSEHSLRIRKKEEPNLIHLDSWLQERVMASKDPYLPQSRGKKISTLHTRGWRESSSPTCPCCKQDHLLFKCEKYKEKTDNQKLSFVKSQRLFFNCLSNSHSVRECSSKKSCFMAGCKRRHHTSLHQALSDPLKETSPASTTVQVSGTSPLIGVMKGNRSVFLQIIPLKVSNRQGKTVQTFGLLDSGSQCTVITKSLCQRLDLPGRMKKVKFGTIKDDEVLPTKIVDLQVSSIDDKFSLNIRNVYSLNDELFNVPGQNVPINSESKWDYLRDIHFPEVQADQVQILVGADAPAALLPEEVRRGGTGLPYASKTPLGWTLVGVYDYDLITSNVLRIGHTKVNESDVELDDLVKKFWETESFGTKANIQSPMSINERDILKTLDKETTIASGHYEVPMLWKPNIDLPESFPVANRRLSSLSKRFQKDEIYFSMYEKNLNDYLQKGHARKLTEEEILKKTDKTWYLPHHGVVNVNKPGKVRMVFDAAAKSAGQSLNSNLSTGPDLVNSLIGVLLRFRKHRVAVTADIEGMFHQVKLKPPDAEAVRFLWRCDPSSTDPPDHYQMLVHIFGATDSPCCAAYALRRAALDQREAFPEKVIDAVLRNFYVDDLLSSVLNDTEAKHLITNLEKLLANRGFNLTKFNSNTKSVLQVITPEKHAMKSSLEFENSVSRALGIKWDLQEDCFMYIVDARTVSGTCTKRQILKKTATVFDPLGFLTPFTLMAKLILQNLWRTNIDWDDDVDASTQESWERWLQELSKISQTIRIPRSFNIQPGYQTQLHLFCDASEKAFAAVAYIRIQSQSEVRCHLIMAKSRVAPIKTLTLPRLELQGAVMAVRLKDIIVEEIDHKFQAIYFWTDSMLNIQYINNEHRRFKVFVGNRIAEIRESSKPSQWRFVPGKLNPADLATRGANMEEADKGSTWLSGPSFLKHSEDGWPMMFETLPLKSNDVEVRTTYVYIRRTQGTKSDRLQQVFVMAKAYPSVFLDGGIHSKLKTKN